MASSISRTKYACRALSGRVRFLRQYAVHRRLTAARWFLAARATGRNRTVAPTRGSNDVSPDIMKPYTYIRDGAEIYRRSFAIIRSEADLSRFGPDEEPVAVRVIHACGQVAAAGDLVFSPGAASAGRMALKAGKPILCDAQMVAHGITRKRLPMANPVICTLSDATVPELSSSIGNTRAAAAVHLWRDHIDRSVVVIGNAPTALFHLLELLDGGWPRPALVIGMPVGFVGAKESKEALMEYGGVPYIVARGRRGGSAMASAAVNALASAAE